MAKKPSAPASTTDTARKIWLAGIGAYGRAFSEAQDSIARLGGETTRVFEDLVEKGEEIERSVEKKGREVAARVAPAASASFDERIRRMRERIGLGEITPAAHEPGELDERLTRIEAKLDRLLAALEHPAPTGKSTATKRKTAVKKKSS